VPKWFNRTVFLEGEAFFKIVKLGKPKNFIVSTIQHNSVEVWGTAFTVFSRDGLDRVALFEGKVQLHVKDKPSHMMYPNDLILVESGKVTQQRFDLASPYLAWKDHSFYFDNSSLNEIIAQANARFGTIIKVNDNNLLNHSLSGSFKARSIDELLSAVGLILNIKFELNDSFYLATKK
jgi:ferric-dicitrate binding protein FerR (iron transport regulator)